MIVSRHVVPVLVLLTVAWGMWAFLVFLWRAQRRRLWLLVALFAVGAAMHVERSLAATFTLRLFINVPSLMFLVAGAVGSFAMYGLEEVGWAFSAGFRGVLLPMTERRRAHRVLRGVRRSLITAAVIGGLLGLHFSLRFLDLGDPTELRRVGPSFAVMFLCPFWVWLVIAFLVEPALTGLELDEELHGREISRGSGESNETGWPGWMLVVMVILYGAIAVDCDPSTVAGSSSAAMILMGFMIPFAVHGVGPTARAVMDGLLGTPQCTEESRRSRATLQDLRHGFHLAGGLLFMIMLIQVLAVTDQWDTFAPNVSVALLPPIHAVFLGDFVVGTLVERTG